MSRKKSPLSPVVNTAIRKLLHLSRFLHLLNDKVFMLVLGVTSLTILAEGI